MVLPSSTGCSDYSCTQTIVIIPFSPFVSAVVMAFDFFVLSTRRAIQEVHLPDALVELRETAGRVDEVEETLQRKLKEVQGLRAGLEALKATIEADQERPDAARLADTMAKVCTTKRALEGVLCLHDKCACDSEVVVPVRQVVTAYRAMAERLEAPSMITGILASVTDEDCSAIDWVLAIHRTSSTSSVE